MNTDNPFAAMLPVATGKLEAIAAIDAKLVKFHGTMAEWQTKAAAVVGETTLAATLAKWNLTADTWAAEFLAPIAKVVRSEDGTVADFVSALVSLTDNTRQYVDDEQTAVIRAGMGTTDESALLAQRAELAKEVEAFRVVLADQNVDGAETLVVPDAPKASRKGGGQPKGASKFLRFYRLDGDAKVYPADSQQKASSVAWYQFGAGVEAMETAMRAAGWDGSYTKPWQGSITVASKDGTKQTTKVIGWDITNDADTETTDDESDGDDAK